MNISILEIIIVCLFSLLALGALYQFVASKLAQRKFLSLGEMVDISDNRPLHVVRTQSFEHGPTVILEAGNGLTSSSWMLVQPEIAKFANCMSYDRAGFGSSPKGLVSPTS